MNFNVEALFVIAPIRPGDDVASLVTAVAASDPDRLPSVVDGTESPADWFRRKPLNASWLAWGRDGNVVGHVGLRLNDRLANGVSAPAGRTVELTRLLVHPDHRRAGIARALAGVATEAIASDRLWITTVVDSPAFEMYLSMGWGVAGTAALVDGSRPGAVLVPDVDIDTRG